MKKHITIITAIVVILIGILAINVNAKVDDNVMDAITGHLDEKTAILLSEYLECDANEVPILPVYYDKNPEWHYENGETLEDRIEQAKSIGYVDYYIIENGIISMGYVTQVRVYHDKEQLSMEVIKVFNEYMDIPIFVRGLDAGTKNFRSSTPDYAICFDGTEHGREPEMYLKFESDIYVAFFDDTVAGGQTPGISPMCSEKFYSTVLYCVGESIKDGNDKVSYKFLYTIAHNCLLSDPFIPVELKKKNRYLNLHHYPFFDDYSYIFGESEMLISMYYCVDQSVREQFLSPDINMDEELKVLDIPNSIIVPIYKDSETWKYDEGKTYKDRLAAASKQTDYLVFDGVPGENVCRISITEVDGNTEIRLIKKYKMSEMPQYILDFNFLSPKEPSDIDMNLMDFNAITSMWHYKHEIFCFDGTENGTGLDVYYTVVGYLDKEYSYMKHYNDTDSERVFSDTEENFKQAVEMFNKATEEKDVEAELWDFTKNYDVSTGVYNDGVNPAVNLKEKYTEAPENTTTPDITVTPEPPTEQPNETPEQTTPQITPEKTPTAEKSWFEAFGVYLITAVALIAAATVAVVVLKKKRA